MTISNPTGKRGFGARPQDINRKGRPKNFDAVRKLAQTLAHQSVKTADGDLVLIDGKTITTVEMILYQWSRSSDSRLQIAFMEYAFGKPPQELRHVGRDGGDLAAKISVPELRPALTREEWDAKYLPAPKG